MKMTGAKAADGMPFWQTALFAMVLAFFASVATVCGADASDQERGNWGHIVISDAPQGALIVDIDRYGPAASSGLFEGDIVTGAGEAMWANIRRINNASELQAVIDGSKPFKAITLTVLHYGKERGVTVLPHGANRIQVEDINEILPFPWKRDPPLVIPKTKLEELDSINVLSQIVIDRKTGEISLIGNYESKFRTGAIPYLDLLKSALEYPEPSVSFPAWGWRLFNLSRDVRTLQLVPTLLAIPEAGTERQIIVRKMAELLGITREEYVKLYNFGYLDSNGSLAPPEIAEIIVKALRHLHWDEAADAYGMLQEGGHENLVTALRVLSAEDFARQALAVQGVTAGEGEDRLLIAVCVAIMRKLGTSDKFPKQTERDLLGLIARMQKGEISSADVVPTVRRLYRFFPIDMFDNGGRSLQLNVLGKLVISDRVTRILGNMSDTMIVQIEAKNLDRNSQLARILAETDYSIKPLAVRPDIFEGFPGFETLEKHNDRSITKLDYKNVPTGWWRWTFEPRKTTMEISSDGRVVRFGTVEIIVSTGPMENRGKGSGPLDLKSLSPVQLKAVQNIQKAHEDWYGRIGRDYDQYAKILPALHEFREAAKIMAFARWASSKHIPLKLENVVQRPSNLPETFAGLARFELLDPDVATNHLGSAFASDVSGIQQMEHGWHYGITGGASLKGRGWIAYTPSKTAETQVSDQLLLSREIGQEAAQVAESGDLETARYLAELSAEALAGSVSRAEVVKRGITVESKARAPVSPATLEVQKELLRLTGKQIGIMENSPGNAEASANLITINRIYEDIRANPHVAEKYLAKIRKGRLFAGSSPQPGKRTTEYGAYACTICYEGLQRNIRSKLPDKKMLASFVDGTVGFYGNCKLKATGSCNAGDQFVKQLRVCDDRRGNETDYAVCIRELMCFANDTGAECVR